MTYHKAHFSDDYCEWYNVIYVNKEKCKLWNYYNKDQDYHPGYYYAMGKPGIYLDSEYFGPYNTVEAIHDEVWSRFAPPKEEQKLVKTP